MMNEVKVLLHAYYEILYDRLEARRTQLANMIDELLFEEVERQDYEGFVEEKFTAYREACMAFVDERIEDLEKKGKAGGGKKATRIKVE